MGRDGLLWLMVPRTDYTIKDTWFVSGLRGTGSKDIVVEEIFVPEHRVVLVADLREARSPGRRIHGTTNFRIPLQAMFS